MKSFVLRPGKCRVIFFDLEFYVPVAGRDKEGFLYNPWDKSCKFLGGSFLVANPEKDLNLDTEINPGRVSSLWLWKSGSERKLLEDIYDLLKSAYDLVYRAHQGKVSPILCGIGISSSDVPILFELFKRYKILSNSDAFSFQNKFRIIDISQLAITTFNNKSSFTYPKSKSLILQKYLPEKKFDSGVRVWDLYDQGHTSAIEGRVIDEVLCTRHCYMKILSDVRTFKYLEKNKKRLTSVYSDSSSI
ncbi:hypothetical protein [Pseudomaricurvus sp. HS19]|uniref:hypothetical protein n=1 Tax=Pseudomaricurvus sp. HS19 TaxID=2692626 RepID=UPI001370196A|nr:hypothetical protein [Pseudomaricurvus sp. HS19]MYM64055.1 hypothetical protein [Pseudomaricurvus sp. HS19]